MRPVFHDTFMQHYAKMSYEEDMTNEVVSPMLDIILDNWQ